jgi:hypothetical protein
LDQETKDKILKDFEASWRMHAQLTLVELTTKVLGSTNLVLLNGLGIDAEKRLLQIFVEEANNLLNGGDDARNKPC